MNTLMQTQGQGARAPAAEDLEHVRERFRLWREKRKKGARIPAALWQAAVSLYPRCSLYQISRSLRLDYADLRNRIECGKGSIESLEAEDHRFMEVRLSEAYGNISECRLRAEEPGGRKVELELKGIAVGQLLQVLAEVWGS